MLSQELFDAVFNYFPITFRPPPDDPYGITAQDLKDRLRDCIASTSDFAPYAFPALLDKLDSTSMNTKVLQSTPDTFRHKLTSRSEMFSKPSQQQLPSMALELSHCIQSHCGTP